MALLLKAAWVNYNYLMNDMMDDRVKDWLFMNSPIPIVIIISAYVYFVTSIGPRMMKKRKAINLENIIICYNIIQTILCSITFYRCNLMVMRINWRCAEISYESDPISMFDVRTGHLYFLTKVTDLLDTVFMVFRKKQNQVSFLHIYHHSFMVAFIWFFLRYFAGGHSIFVPYFNSFVHIIMYSYYLATTWNKELKKNAWWKKYITQLQLVQFFALLCIYFVPLFTPNCGYPKVLIWMFIPQNLLLTVLFGDFYYKTYIKKRANKIK